MVWDGLNHEATKLVDMAFSKFLEVISQKLARNSSHSSFF